MTVHSVAFDRSRTDGRRATLVCECGWEATTIATAEAVEAAAEQHRRTVCGDCDICGLPADPSTERRGVRRHAACDAEVRERNRRLRARARGEAV